MKTAKNNANKGAEIQYCFKSYEARFIMDIIGRYTVSARAYL